MRKKMHQLSVKQHQNIRLVDNQTCWATQQEVGWHQKIWGSNHRTIGANSLERKGLVDHSGPRGNMDKNVDQIDTWSRHVLSKFQKMQHYKVPNSFVWQKQLQKKSWKTDNLVKLHHLYHLWTLQLYIAYEVISLLMCRKVALCYHDPKTCQ